MERFLCSTAHTPPSGRAGPQFVQFSAELWLKNSSFQGRLPIEYRPVPLMAGSTAVAIQQTRPRHTSTQIVKINLRAYVLIKFSMFMRKVTIKTLIGDIIFDDDEQVF